MIQTIIEQLIFLAGLNRFEIKEIRMHPAVKAILIKELTETMGAHPITWSLTADVRYSGYPVVIDARVILEVKKK